ncbi:MAG TPA: glycine cleavage system protein GcvH [Deltaproteobacteria bacterium]|nr:glycine cleavage system protein GcvH [Deltaproteobacteria bacterium]HQB38034.1 glycine cleavage system protein GcvH [Deltaproteobacteria bacterium]
MSEIYFNKDHEWIRVEGRSGRIGISEHAAHALGDVTYVDLPKVGGQLRQFEVMAGIESVKAASDIYAPVSGKVLAVNPAMDTAPELVNQDPEGEAWMAEVEISDPAELKKLMSREQYEEYLKTL